VSQGAELKAKIPLLKCKKALISSAPRTALGRHPRTLAQAGGFASVGVRFVGDRPAALHSVVAEAPNFATIRT
jgi:hypothetical protein